MEGLLALLWTRGTGDGRSKGLWPPAGISYQWLARERDTSRCCGHGAQRVAQERDTGHLETKRTGVGRREGLLKLLWTVGQGRVCVHRQKGHHRVTHPGSECGRVPLFEVEGPRLALVTCLCPAKGTNRTQSMHCVSSLLCVRCLCLCCARVVGGTFAPAEAAARIVGSSGSNLKCSRSTSTSTSSDMYSIPQTEWYQDQ